MKNKIIFGFILFAALVLRMAGTGFGIYHADEPIVVNHALQYATGDLNPHFFKIPPLASYLCFLMYGAWFVLGKLVGVFASAQDFQTLFIHRPEVFYQVGRIALGVIPGTLTVWAVWSGARRMAGERVAIWASAAMAFNFLHARDSHAIYADILMTLLVWACAVAAVSFFKRPDHARALWAGIAVGAATAAKYNALLAGAAVLLAWILVSRKFSAAVRVLAGACAAFVALNPFAVLDGGTCIREILSQASAEGPVSLTHLIGYSLAESCGWGLLITAAAGCAAAFARDRKAAAVLFAFPAIFFAKLVFFSQPHERYVMPLVPFLAVAFGYGVDLVIGAAERKGSGKRVASIVMASALLFGAVKIVAADMLFVAADTRDQAREWIMQNIAPGSRVAFTDTRLRPRLERDRRQWQGEPARAEANAKARLEYEASEAGRGYYLNFIEERMLAPFAGVWPAVPATVEELRHRGIRYVVAHHGTEDSPSWRADLKARARLVKRFSPYLDPAQEAPSETWSVTFAAYSWRELLSRNRFGPVLEVYEL